MENKELCIHGNNFTMSSTTCNSFTSCPKIAIERAYREGGYEEVVSRWGEEVAKEYSEKYGFVGQYPGIDGTPFKMQF